MPNGTAENEYMHESIEKDAVKFDLDTDQIIAALCYDNEELQAENINLQAELEKHRWIPVTERLPEKTKYCCSEWAVVTDGETWTIARYDFPYKRWGKDHSPYDIDMGDITHWKPILPE